MSVDGLRDWTTQFRQLRETAGAFRLPPRTAVELTGRDRQKFVHNLCTNDIKSLVPGQGREAFLCNVQGKILDHVFVLCQTDRLLINSPLDQSERLVAHLNKYLIADDVQVCDRSQLVSHWLVAGPAAEEKLAALGITVPGRYLDHVTSPSTRSNEVILPATMCCRVTMAGENSFLLQADASLADSVHAGLGGMFPWCTDQVFDALRSEAGFPWYGIDLDDKWLPQEVGRDAWAVSFTKGCYLGQETVARIDALGHVNWHLVRIVGDGHQVPTANAELLVENRSVGVMTSAVFSPARDAAIGFARIRREFAASGTRLTIGDAGQPGMVL